MGGAIPPPQPHSKLGGDVEKWKEHLDKMNHIIGLETNNMIEVKGEELDKIKNMLFIHWDPEPIYVTKTNIILTDINEYEQFIKVNPDHNLIMKLEIIDFNVYLYVIAYNNHPEINEIFKRLEGEEIEG